MKEVIGVFYLCMFITFSVFGQNEGAVIQPFQPPIPTELFVGENSSMYQMIVSKQIPAGRKFGFFNLINYEVDNEEHAPIGYIIQSVFDYKVVNGLKVGVGTNLKIYEGLKPLVLLNYSVFTKDVGFLIQPSYEVHKDGYAEVFSMFEWHPENKKKIQPYFRVQGLVSFSDINAFSYHYWRVGMQYKMFRVGPALNVQYFGSEDLQKTNFGGFITILIK